VQYSGVKDKKPRASIMEIHPNSIDRGADISEFSQYPAEKEFLFVPMSFVQGSERCRVEVGPGGGVLSVIPVHVNINIKTDTVEQLLGKKKSMHLMAFKSLIDETKCWMQAHAEQDGRARVRATADKEYGKYGSGISRLISETVKQMQEFLDTDSDLPDNDYVNDLKYKALVFRMLSAQDWSKQKLKLWLENEETDIRSVTDSPLKSAHRQWLSFLKQGRYSIAPAGSEQRKTAAIHILQCKGLMATDDASTEELDGEPLIYAAVADGCALEDLQAWPVATGRLALLTPARVIIFSTHACLQFVIDAGADPAAENYL
jgi:hypothetical protein